MIKNVIQNSIAFTDKGPRKGWRTPLNIKNDSEQRDEEKEGFRGPFASERGDEPRSGIPNGSTYSYTYFGVRYMDHELMTMWLSVDPMADKYPNISPYAYCAWNPVKLVDPDGNEFFITGGDGVKYYLTINKDRSLRWVSRDGQSYNIEDNPWVSKLTTAITTLMGKSKTAENVITTLVKDPNHDIEKYAVWVENRVRHEMGLPRRLYYYFNVFVKPNAEGKSRSVCTMPRRENDP